MDILIFAKINPLTTAIKKELGSALYVYLPTEIINIVQSFVSPLIHEEQEQMINKITNVRMNVNDFFKNKKLGYYSPILSAVSNTTISIATFDRDVPTYSIFGRNIDYGCMRVNAEEYVETKKETNQLYLSLLQQKKQFNDSYRVNADKRMSNPRVYVPVQKFYSKELNDIYIRALFYEMKLLGYINITHFFSSV